MAAFHGLGSLFDGIVSGYKDVSGIIRDQQSNEWFRGYLDEQAAARKRLKDREAAAGDVKTTPITEKAGTGDPTAPVAPTPALTTTPPTLTPTSVPARTIAPTGTMLPGGRATVPPAPIELPTGSVPAFAPASVPAAAPAVVAPKPIDPDAASDASAGVPAPYAPPPLVRINPDGTSITPVTPPAPSALGTEIRRAPTTSGWGTAEAIGRGVASIPTQLYDAIRRGLAIPTPIQPPRALNPSAPAYVAPTTQTDAFGRPIADPNTVAPRGILY